MADVKITDLVEQQVIDRIKELGREIKTLLDTYTNTARELAHGIEVPVRAIGDLERLEALLTTQSQEAIRTTERLNVALQQQGQVISQTTPVISRQLMEQERVNKTQREAYTEHDRVKRLLDHFHDTYENQAVSLVKLNKELQQNKDAQSKLEKQLSTGQVSMAQYTQRMAELITQQRSLSQEKKTLTQLMTAEEKAGQEVEDSYVALSQKLELLKKAYKGLSEEGRGSEYGQELENTIQNLDAHLKDMAADMGEFQRNVGNYAIASKNGIVTTESLNVALTQEAHTVKDLTDQNKILTEARSMLDMSSADYAQTLATVNAKIDENNKKIEESGQSNSSLKKDLKELVLEIATLSMEYAKLSEEEKNSAEGQELKEHIQELTEQAGALKDAIADTNQAIANAASDTRGFDQLGQGLQLAVDGFGLATGAAAMFGLSSEEAAEVQAKLMGAIAASNAMTKIQTALQKQSAVMQGVANLQTKAGAIAIKLKTAAEGKGVVTTKLLTAAQWLFNKACYANPIGLLVLAIMACIAAAYALIKVFSLFGGDSEKRKKNYENEKQALENLQKSNERAMAAAKARGASEWEASNLSIQAKEAELAQAQRVFAAAQKAYDDDDDEYKEALDSKKAASEAYWQAIEDGYNGVMSFLSKYYDEIREEEIGHVEFVKEKANEDYENQVKLIKKKMEAQLGYVQSMMAFVAIISGVESAEYAQLQTQYNNLIAQQNQLIADLGAARDRAIAKAEKEQAKKDADAAKKRADAAKKAADEAKKREEAILKEQIKARQAELDLIVDTYQRRIAIENNNYENQKRELEKRIAELGDTELSMRIALQSQLESLTTKHTRTLTAIELENATSTLNKQKEILGLKLSIVKENSAEELDLRKQIATNANAIELKAIEQRIAKGEITEEEGAELKRLLALNLAHEIEEITQEHNENLISMAQERLAKEQLQRDNKYINDVAALKDKYAQEMLAAKGNKDEQEKLTQQFNEAMAAMDEQYAIKTAQASVKAIEAALQMEGLSAAERERLAVELAKAKADLANASADAEIAAAQRVVDADNKATEKRIANAQMWMQKAAEAMNAINDLASTIYDGKIQRLEDEQEANDEAAEAEQERISNLVEQNVITQEEGEARKRAAETATSKKNEELEKKKAALKHKQAVWDKANSIAQCGISTALAIMNALQMQPFPVGIAMAAIAGAMGAVQLATILATPIPKYAKGTDYHKGGPAVVGDGGQQEVVMYHGAAYLTPDTPTLVDIPAGASVLPSVAGIDESLTKVVALSSTPTGDRPVIVNNDYTELKREITTLVALVKTQTKQQRIIASNAEFNAYRVSI